MFLQTDKQLCLKENDWPTTQQGQFAVIPCPEGYNGTCSGFNSKPFQNCVILRFKDKICTL